MQTSTGSNQPPDRAGATDPKEPRSAAAEYLDLWELQVTSTALRGALPRSGLPWKRS